MVLKMVLISVPQIVITTLCYSQQLYNSLYVFSFVFRVMSNGLMAQLNMDGGGNKAAFRKTTLFKIMIGIVMHSAFFGLVQSPLLWVSYIKTVINLMG